MLGSPKADPRLPPQSGVFGNTGAMPDQPSPIDPTWIRNGTPITRCRDHSATQDGAAWTTFWDCTRSKFEWHYQFDEVVVILEGSVRVTDSHGMSRTLSQGDVAYFPYGSSWVWEVDHYVRKIAFCHESIPPGMRLPVRAMRRLARAPHGMAGAFASLGKQLAKVLRRVARAGRVTATVVLIGLPL